MMMRRFVKRVLNSPQRRCHSIKQVALEMSGERQRRERFEGQLADYFRCMGRRPQNSWTPMLSSSLARIVPICLAKLNVACY